MGYGWCSAANQMKELADQPDCREYSKRILHQLRTSNTVADFTADNTNGNAPLIVQFSDASTNYPTSWAGIST
jgi:PKD repeat protein